MSKLYLFTSPTCFKCPAAKELINTHNLDCEIIEVGTILGGEALALKAKVRGVPQFVIQEDNNYNHINLDDEKTFEIIKNKFKKLDNN